MKAYSKPQSTALVIFGAGGDLTWRKLVPALYSLFVDDWMPEKFAIIGVDWKKMSDSQFRKHLHDGVKKFSHRPLESDKWNEFSRRLS